MFRLLVRGLEVVPSVCASWFRVWVVLQQRARVSSPLPSPGSRSSFFRACGASSEFHAGGLEATAKRGESGL